MTANRCLRLRLVALAAALQGLAHGATLRGGRGGGLARSGRPDRGEEGEERGERELQWLSNQTCYWSNGTAALGCPGFLESGTCLNSPGCAASEQEAYSSAYETCGEGYEQAFTVWLRGWPAECPWRYVCCYHPGGGSAAAAAAAAGTDGGGAGSAGASRAEPDGDHPPELQRRLPRQTCYWPNGTEAPNCPGFNGTCLAVAEAV
jgi:hypothetical protein